MSFYRYFDEECETPNAVVENLKKKGVIEPTRQRHFYSAIDLAREKYAETNRHRPDQELKEIFAFVPVGERISLYREVNHRLRGPETESKETCILIVAALCRMDAVQPFTVLYHDGAPFCPFVAYAETGAHMVLREMLEQLSNKIALEKVKGSKEYQSELMEKLTNTYKDQAPAIVLTAVRKHMEALQLILEFAPELEIGQEVIDYSIDEDNEALFRILITHHRSHIMRPNNLCYAIQQEAIRIIQYIFHTLDPATPELQALLTRNTVEQIICAKKSTELWNICCLGQLCNKLYDSEKCNLLHIAIAKGKAKIVVDMIQGFPDLLVKKDQEKRYAIAKLKGGDFSNETERRSTRDKCVAELLKRENRHESRRILQESEVDVHQTSLDLSSLDTGRYEFEQYADRFCSQDCQTGPTANFWNTLEFENVLLEVIFPDLDINHRMSNPTEDCQVDHHEIHTVLRWLKSKGVKEIMRIRVPDRLRCPHDHELIHKCSKEFRVRDFDWRRMDLFLAETGHFSETRRLVLYSSGNPAVIQHWKNKIPTFTKLEKLDIVVVADAISNKRAERVRRIVEDEFKSSSVHPQIVVDRWSRPQDYSGLQPLGNLIGDLEPDLARFITSYKNEMRCHNHRRRIKIAVIDTGITAVGEDGYASPTIKNPNQNTNGSEPQQPLNQNGSVSSSTASAFPDGRSAPRQSLLRNIKSGKSFVFKPDLVEQPWWLSQDPHGTQMARLICAIDPECELFIANVADSFDSSPRIPLVTQAVKWAVSQEVDIISMSFALYKKDKDFNDAIYSAHEKDVIVFCSTSDEGNNRRDVYPAALEYSNVVRIVPCDEYGKELSWSQTIHNDKLEHFRVRGTNILTGSVPFLAAPEHISGSSPATAIAAGLGSLILSCCNLAGNEKAFGQRIITVKARLNAMTGSHTTNYILPKQILGSASDIPLDPFDFKELVMEHFRDFV